MSASRDQSQKVAFVYSNLYQIYQKGKSAAKDAVTTVDASVSGAAPVTAPEAPLVVPKQASPQQASSGVLKAGDLHEPGKPAPKISSYTPAELIGKRIARPSALPEKAPKHAIVSLKDNLNALNELHSRLRFMLQELEDLVKD